MAKGRFGMRRLEHSTGQTALASSLTDIGLLPTQHEIIKQGLEINGAACDASGGVVIITAESDTGMATRARPMTATNFYPLVALLPFFVRWLSLNPSCQVDSAPPPILEITASTKYGLPLRVA